MGKKKRARRLKPESISLDDLPPATFSGLVPPPIRGLDLSSTSEDAVGPSTIERPESELAFNEEARECGPTIKDYVELSQGYTMPIPVGYLDAVEYQRETAFGSDENIDILCDNMSTCGYNFLCYPIAGMQRAAAYRRSYFDANSPRRISVSDLSPPHVILNEATIQRPRAEGVLYGYISPWVDCDHPNTEFAKYSMRQMFGYELPNAEYMGWRTLIIEIRRRDNPNLIKMLLEWCWRRTTRLRFYIIYPSSLSEIEGAKPDDEIWQLWSDFRKQLHNYGRDKLSCGIKFVGTVDDEFKIQKKAKRWRGEPLELFWYDYSALKAFKEIDHNESNFLLRMPSDYTAFILYVYHNNEQRCMISGSCASPRYMAASMRLLDSVRYVVSKIIRSFDIVRNLVPHMEDYGIDFSQHLQTPLRPAEDLLSRAVYETFEDNVHKYDAYRNAITAAVTDLFDEQICTQSKVPVILIVGAGRGGLVKEVICVEETLRNLYDTKPWKMIAIERNPFAASTLEHYSRYKWSNRIRIIKADARDESALKPLLPEKADIVMSEMLGSFGCNELCPETLRNIELNHCKERTIFIPYKYTNFVEPMFSMSLMDSVKCQRPHFFKRFCYQRNRYPDETATCATDRMYVISMNHYYRVALPQPCLEFKHPDPTGPFSRKAIARFNVEYAADVSGFAGYFYVHLYKDIKFTTIPARKKSAAMSWFPMYIPLRAPLRCPEGSTITFQVSREAEEDGSWYEWNAVVAKDGKLIEESPIQNEEGRFDFMRLPSLDPCDVDYDDSLFHTDAIDKYMCEYS